MKGPGGMTWHLTIIRWCLSMNLKSPAVYNQLSKSGLLYLPSQYTLKTYSNFSENMPGVNPKILHLFVKEMNLPGTPAFQRKVCLVRDEMKIWPGLVIYKGAGRVIGLNHKITSVQVLGTYPRTAKASSVFPSF